MTGKKCVHSSEKSEWRPFFSLTVLWTIIIIALTVLHYYQFYVATNRLLKNSANELGKKAFSCYYPAHI